MLKLLFPLGYFLIAIIAIRVIYILNEDSEDSNYYDESSSKSEAFVFGILWPITLLIALGVVVFGAVGKVIFSPTKRQKEKARKEKKVKEAKALEEAERLVMSFEMPKEKDTGF